LLKTTFNFDEASERLCLGEEEGRGEEEVVTPHDRDAPGAGKPPAPRLLSELPPGQDAVIDTIDASGPIGRRLLDLGLLPGTPVRALRRAPLGDPGVFELRGYRLCLRKSESSRVRLRARSHTPPRKS
jgi:ferrous iron transport protein A